MRENKNYISVTFLPDGLEKIPKKSKKIKKIPLQLLFKPKQVGKGREREKRKIIVPFRSYPTRNRKLQKNSKKFQKIKKIPFWLLFKPKQDGKGRERKKINIIVPLRSYSTSDRKFQKKQQKNSKN